MKLLRIPRRAFLVTAISLAFLAAPRAANADGGIFAFSSARSGGGHHGHRTDLLLAAADFVVVNHADDVLSAGPDPRICAMQRRLGPNPLRESTTLVAALLADHLQKKSSNVASLLVSPVYCQSLNASVIRPGKKGNALPEPIPFYVDAGGVPVSGTNPVFNLCISGKPVPLALIRANHDRVILDHRGKITAGASCQKYFIGDERWRHPDHPELDYFTFRMKPGIRLSVPSPYVILRMEAGESASVGDLSVAADE